LSVDMDCENKSESYFDRNLFKMALECPTRLYYEVHNYPKDKASLPFINLLRYNKNLLKRLTRLFFSDAIIVSENNIKEDAQKTAELLTRKEVTVFDAVFLRGIMKVRCPILEKKDNSVVLYKIETKSFNLKNQGLVDHQGKIYSKWKNYLMEFAYQCYLISRQYPGWKLKPVLVLPNKHGKALHDNLHKLIMKNKPGETFLPSEKDLLAFVDVKEEVDRILSGKEWQEYCVKSDKFGNILGKFVDLYRAGEKYPVEIGAKCNDCTFNLPNEQVCKGEVSGFQECWKDWTGNKNENKLVFDLIGPGKGRLVEEEIYLQKDVPEEEIADLGKIQKSKGKITEKHRQALQIMKAKGKDIPEEIIRSKLFDELEKWEYPLHFLDFEAGNYAIPVRKGRKPYHLIAYQFSCHTLYKDGSRKHRQWLDPMKGNYPNFELIRNLKSITDIF